MRIAVIGGSAGGLSAALLLARAGTRSPCWRPTISNRPSMSRPPPRRASRAAPQIVQPHVLLTTFQEILRERLPDVDAGLRSAGAVEATLQSQMPPTLADRSPSRATSGWYCS